MHDPTTRDWLDSRLSGVVVPLAAVALMVLMHVTRPAEQDALVARIAAAEPVAVANADAPVAAPAPLLQQQARQ
jgi:hypothetical protein